MTRLKGAEIIMECLRKEGVEIHLRLPRRRQPADVRRAALVPRHPAHPRPPRAGAPRTPPTPTRASRGKAGVCWATSGPGATNLVTGIANAWMDSVPLVCITGQVGLVAARPRRLPGSGHHRHHDPDHEAQHARARRRGHRPGDRRGVPHRHDRPARPRAGRHPARRAAGDVRVRVPGEGRAAPATSRRSSGTAQQVKKAAQLDRRVGAAADPRRPRRRHLARRRRAGEARREGADPGRSRRCSASAASPARTSCNMGMPGMHGMYWNNIAIQEADLIIAIGMRFDDRVTGAPQGLRAEREDHPHRHRSGGDRQERARRWCRSSAT